MYMTRRHLCGLMPLVALAGCATAAAPAVPSTAELQQLIAGAQALEASLVTNVPLLLASPAVHLSAGDAANVTAGLQGLVQATNALSTATTLTAGTTLSNVQKIETTLNTIVSVAASIPVVPEPEHSALVAAAVALPPLEALVGLAVTQGTALAATIAAGKVTPAAAS
jgi:hypothetical protein